MNGIGKPEKVTQDRVVKLFVDELGYKYLGEWRDRVGNSNIEKKLLESYLEKRGYSAPQIVKALYTLQSLANRPHRSLYDNNKAVYGLLRYGVNVKVESQTLGSVEPGGLSIFAHTYIRV